MRSREGACVSVPVVLGCVGVGVVVEALRRGVVRYVVDWRIEGRVRDRGVVIEARRGIVARSRWLGAIVGGEPAVALPIGVGWDWRRRGMGDGQARKSFVVMLTADRKSVV